jgi:hypothetical protein
METDMSLDSLVKAAQEFLDTTAYECYQPGEAKDKARDNLKSEIEKARTSASIPNEFHLLDLFRREIENLLKRPPIVLKLDNGNYSNTYIDEGWKAAVRAVLALEVSWSLKPDIDQMRDELLSGPR